MAMLQPATLERNSIDCKRMLLYNTWDVWQLVYHFNLTRLQIQPHDTSSDNKVPVVTFIYTKAGSQLFLVLVPVKLVFLASSRSNKLIPAEQN